MVRAIVGANWGDEGKGKITDMLAKESDIIVRFQGGSNAGHTIINNYGKFALHLLPSGVFYNHTTSIIGNGVALNIPFLVKELNDLTSQGVPMPKILVSDRAQILMPYHILFDTYEEARLAGKSFGSTKSGIAPFYSDKYAKIGFQVNELFGDEKELMDKIENVCTLKNVMLEHLYHQPALDPKEIFNTLMEYKEMALAASIISMPRDRYPGSQKPPSSTVILIPITATILLPRPMESHWCRIQPPLSLPIIRSHTIIIPSTSQMVSAIIMAAETSSMQKN